MSKDLTMKVLLLINVLLLTYVGCDVTATEESCDSNQLYICRALVPKSTFKLPDNKEELDNMCSIYHRGMGCMDAWMQRCLPTDSHKFIEQQLRGSRALMRYLCSNETAFRKEYLKESSCWGKVSKGWESCVYDLDKATEAIISGSNQLVIYSNNFELCCAHEEYLKCVTKVGRVCSAAGSTLLRRMAWILSRDVVSCSGNLPERCAAPLSTACSLSTVTGLLLYKLF